MSIDNRPFPRTEKCWSCELVDVDVISPADSAVCPSCHLAMMDDNDADDVVYGFPLVTNPHQFQPDEESCSPEEIARWKADCELYDSGQTLGNPREGSGWYVDSEGNRTFHLLTTAWGIGTNFLNGQTVSPDFGPHVARAA